MKIHLHLIDKIIQSLDSIFNENKYADKVLEKTFKQNRQLGSRDRKFIAEAVYECVRHCLYYQTVAESRSNEAVLATHFLKTLGEIPPHTAFSKLNKNNLAARLKQDYPAQILFSFPSWMNEMGLQEFGAEWGDLMKALNQPAEVHLRTNRLKITKDQLITSLAEEDIQVVTDKMAVDGLTLKERKNVFTTQAFKKGYFEVQDMSSQMIAPLLAVEPGHRVVDACAGAGGKSLHLASLMKNKGKIISMDIFQWKLDELKKRASRNGVDIIETKLIDSTKVIKRLENSFDRVLLDVPCSGMGVIRRNPDAKWKLTAEEIERLTNLQKELLVSYSKMCKKNGLMVYATCSILKKENEDQVNWFLNESSEKGQWSFVKDMRLWPHKDGYDGFYAAVLKPATS